MLERVNSKSFLITLICSAFFIAGCAAFFSVRGISLLFAGSTISVTIMASSLEIGKIVAASFLYRQWDKMKLIMKIYLTGAVIVLVGITSLGVYGFLSDAFDRTMSKVSLYESNIQQIEKQIATHNNEILKIETASDTVDEKATESIAQYQKIYDDFVTDKRERQESLRAQIKTMDQQVADIESSPGGLFSSKSSKLKKLKEEQAQSRDEINKSLQSIDLEIDKEYKEFLSKVERLRTATEQVPDNVEDVNTIYSKIRVKEQEIQGLREDIRNTDIGSFKFIARSFEMELEQVVKWFILIICAVFDPLAVILVVGINMMIVDMMKPVNKKKGSMNITGTNENTHDSNIVVDPNKIHIKWYRDTNEIENVTKDS